MKIEKYMAKVRPAFLVISDNHIIGSVKLRESLKEVEYGISLSDVLV